MKLIAWDTSSKAGAVVALEWDANSPLPWASPRWVAEFTLNVDCTHSERLLWAIHQTLEAARWRLEDVDVFGVGVGPGSFTGLRIGVTTARTLAHTMEKPLVAVSSLAALARPAALHFAQFATSSLDSKESKTLVIAATDACKGELFALWGTAKSVSRSALPPEGDFLGVWQKGAKEQVLSPERLAQVLTRKLATTSARWIVIGEGRQRYSSLWDQLPRSREIKDSLLFPAYVQGRYLGLLVWEVYQAKVLRESLDVYPRYLRASDAELKLKAGLLKSAPQGALPEPVRGSADV